MRYIITDGLQTISKPLNRRKQVCKKGLEILARRSARIGKEFFCPTQFPILALSRHLHS
jgi:hypothetical protein